MSKMNNHSRQSFLGDRAETEFQKQKIAIIGLCGGGSHIAQQLAHIGFSQFVICDYDHVEETNLTRMIGSRPSDASTAEKKSRVIERLIKEINPAAHVEAVTARWQEAAKLLRDCSIIFGCVDKLLARDELERFCRRFLIPYIDIGMDVHACEDGFAISGQVAISLPNCPCLRCMGILRDDALAKEQARYGDAGGRPQVVWPNGILASTAVAQFLGLILPWSTSVKPQLLTEYDGNRQQLRESPKLRFFENTQCHHYETNMELGDPFFSVADLAYGGVPEK
jgi:molybdopterin/thiamine biosynthesis adenylyltransferase